ncbi:MAG: hypothetical protein PVJ09_01305 [Candidatus Woesebacteria bacterium]|jgi:hypothetical protein
MFKEKVKIIGPCEQSLSQDLPDGLIGFIMKAYLQATSAVFEIQPRMEQALRFLSEAKQSVLLTTEKHCSGTEILGAILLSPLSKEKEYAWINDIFYHGDEEILTRLCTEVLKQYHGLVTCSNSPNILNALMRVKRRSEKKLALRWGDLTLIPPVLGESGKIELRDDRLGDEKTEFQKAMEHANAIINSVLSKTLGEKTADYLKGGSVIGFPAKIFPPMTLDRISRFPLKFHPFAEELHQLEQEGIESVFTLAEGLIPSSAASFVILVKTES